MRNFMRKCMLALSDLWHSLGLGRFSFMRHVADLIMRSTVPWGVRYYKHKLYGWKFKYWVSGYELETVAFFERNVRQGDVVADVGAAVGYYTMLFSDLVGKEGRVVAFEPDPVSFARLGRAAGNVSNITLEPLGVSDHVGNATLYGREGGNGANSIAYTAGRYSSVVAVTDLSSYEREHGMRFAWAKIDVEGADLEVLGAMRKIPCVVEFSTVSLRKVGVSPQEFLDRIRGLGYNYFFINPDGSYATLPDNELIAYAIKQNLNIYLKPLTI
jgi:FkbM family methyltransferase